MKLKLLKIRDEIHILVNKPDIHNAGERLHQVLHLKHKLEVYAVIDVKLLHIPG
uniref:Uncharacterized protein n=1 Tax=Rhizophora mucronata TaxID=61149 RepID=A0A2P2PRB4_RHIMU